MAPIWNYSHGLSSFFPLATSRAPLLRVSRVYRLLRLFLAFLLSIFPLSLSLVTRYRYTAGIYN